MKADEVIEIETTGWTNPVEGEAAIVLAGVRLGPAPPGKEGSLLSVVIHHNDVSGTETEAHALIAPGAPLARKLRRLATFARLQGRIAPEMDVQDELRAMEVLAKTLDSLDEETSSRVLSWLTARAQAADLKRLGRGARGGSPLNNTFADAASLSVRIAKDHVLG